MDFWVILLSIFISCFALFLWRTMTFFTNTGIPHDSPWPIFGNMAPALFRREHINDLVTRHYKRWSEAKYFGFYDFITPVVVIRDVELIKSIGVKNFETFPDHRSFVNENSDPLFGKSLFGLKGNRWKEVRNLLSPAFTASKMRQMSELMATCAKDFVEFVAERAKTGDDEMEMKVAFSKYTNDVIATCAFGIQVNTMKDPDNDFFAYGKEAVDFSGWKMVKIMFVRFCPWLANWFNVRIVHRKVVDFFTNIVSSTMETREREGIVRPDMIQLMMETKDKSGVQLDIVDMTAQAFLFFFAGFDGSASLMSFVSIALVLNPKVQDRLLEEVDEVMRETKGNPKYDQIYGMEYLEALLYETLRFYSSAGFLDRICIKGFELPPSVPGGKPYVVQPGTNVWFPAAAIQMDPEYYAEPEKFDPDRFLNQKVTINMPTYLAFGIGPRACIGNRFALLETKLILFYLLTKCKFEKSPKLKLPISYLKSSIAVVVDGGAWLKIVPRK